MTPVQPSVAGVYGPVALYYGDSRAVLTSLPDASVDSVVTDPPYGLGFMGKAWDAPDGAAFAVAFWREVLRVLKPGAHVLCFGGTRTYHRLVCAIEDAGFEIRDQIGYCYGTGFPKSRNLNGEWKGWGSALKPAWEPICVARKPLIGTIVENVLMHGTGALNIDACRVEGEAWGASGDLTGGNTITAYGNGLNNSGKSESHTLGRWPANLVHDGSDEVLACFPETKSGNLNAGHKRGSGVTSYDGGGGVIAKDYGGDSGSAARFFYCAKASKADRAGSKHPTVKPIKLMRYLCRLVTPPGGTVLDPFAGSGSTLYAARDEEFSSIGIEREREYVDHILSRLSGQPLGAQP